MPALPEAIHARTASTRASSPDGGGRCLRARRGRTQRPAWTEPARRRPRDASRTPTRRSPRNGSASNDDSSNALEVVMAPPYRRPRWAPARCARHSGLEQRATGRAAMVAVAALARRSAFSARRPDGGSTGSFHEPWTASSAANRGGGRPAHAARAATGRPRGTWILSLPRTGEAALCCRLAA